MVCKQLVNSERNEISFEKTQNYKKMVTIIFGSQISLYPVCLVSIDQFWVIFRVSRRYYDRVMTSRVMEC